MRQKVGEVTVHILTEQMTRFAVELSVAVTLCIWILSFILGVGYRLCGLVVRVSGYRSGGPEIDSRPYQIFWEARGLERSPLSFVRTIEELLEWSSGRGNSLRWPRNTLYPEKFALTSPTSGGSVDIVRLRCKATEFSFFLFLFYG
jgi:hypothetical protein